MRKFFAILLTLSLCFVGVAFAGCSKSSEAENKAKSFVKSLYTVSSKEVALTDYIANSQSSEKIIELQEKFKPMMTDDAYTRLTKNTTYYEIAKYVAKNKAELKASDVKLNEESKSDDLIEYTYTVTAKAQDKDIKEEGKVQVQAKTGKVSYIERIKTDNFLKS